MLCKRLVFTNEVVTDLDEIAEYIAKADMEYTLYEEQNYVEIEIKTDDEKLYELCCFLSEQIKNTLVRTMALKLLHRQYNCFNNDEKKVILLSVLKSDFLNELPGRMYIYLKINNTINPVAFYNFMCRDISDKVETSSYEEAEKMLKANDNADFIEILRFFSGVSPDSAEMVELTADSSGVRISACYPENSTDKLQEFGEESSDLLSDLVTLNPKHISVYGRDEFLNSDLAGVITAVFNERIEYKG